MYKVVSIFFNPLFPYPDSLETELYRTRYLFLAKLVKFWHECSSEPGYRISHHIRIFECKDETSNTN